MSLRKKAVTSTLAASLVLGTISGLPLSPQGVLGKLGLSSVAQAADAGTVIPGNILNRYQKFYSMLKDDEEGWNAVQIARDKVNVLKSKSDEEKAAYVSEIVERIHNHPSYQAAPENYPNLNATDIFDLFASLAIYYDPKGNNIQNNVTDSHLRAVLDDLARLGGLTGLDGSNGINFTDVLDFEAAVEDAVIAKIQGKSAAELLVLVVQDGEYNPKPAKELLEAAIDDVLAKNDPNRSGYLKISQILTGVGITARDINSVRARFTAFADPNGAASLALAGAFIRTSVVAKFENADNGKAATPVLTVFGYNIPNELLQWKAAKEDEVEYSSGKFRLKSGKSESQTGVEARVAAGDRNVLVYKGTLNLKYTGGGFYGGGGGGIAPDVKSPANAGQIISDAQQAINSVKEQLKNATQAQREKLLADLKRKIEAAIKQIATLDASSLVTIDGGKATAKLDSASLIQTIKEIAEQAKKLNDQLTALDPGVKPAAVELTFDLGSVQADSTEVSIAKEIMAALKDNGIGSVAVQVNGAVVAIQPAAYQAETKIVIGKKDAKVATDVTKLPLASDVYEFEIYKDGNKLAKFDSSVELRIPADVSKADPELLTLAKIVDGKIVIYGGHYDAGNKKFIASRNSFSIYTVVENKIVFDDIASVKDWAGRQIQVAAAKGIIDGRASGQFVPNDKVTRAEFAKMIVTEFGLEDDQATENFTDVNDSDWFRPYVAAAVKNGIVNGRTADKFDPNGTITRAEMATMAARALVATGKYSYDNNADEALKIFTDAASIHSSMKDGVALAAKLGIVIGEEGNKLNPNNDSTRAQAAVVIYRLLDK